jgi:hypothetical protein
MRKETPVLPVNRAVYTKRIIGKKVVGQGGGEAQGVADQKNITICKIREKSDMLRC